MLKQSNFLTVYQDYERYIQATQPFHRATQILNEFRSVLSRVILPVWGFERTDPKKKMTQSEARAVIEFLKSLPVRQLLKMREGMQQGFDRLQSSQASRNTYGARVEHFLGWTEQEGYFPNARLERIKDQCCPAIVRGRGSVSSLRLTERTGKYRAYALKREEMLPELRQEMDELLQFWTTAHYPGRVVKPIKLSSARVYLKEVERLLGFVVRHAAQPVSIEALSLEDLIPYLPEEEWAQATSRQQKKLWKPLREQVERLLCSYFGFIEQFSESLSPSTRANKVSALIAVLKFLYRADVQEPADYKAIPLFTVLSKYLKEALEQKQQWQGQRRRTVDEAKKFPDPEPGKTALEVIHERVLEPLRLECGFRYSWGGYRDGKAIAISLQRLLQWALVTLYPARRQEEQRTLRVALSCPVQRPEGIPEGGWYLPLLPPEERERSADRTISDNFLFRTYHHDGQAYPKGLYVLDIRNYKTQSKYGAQTIPLPDRSFEDGTSFYEYLDRYLCGWWVCDRVKGEEIYDWWEPSLRGRRGRWVSAGRLSLFEPSRADRQQKRTGVAPDQADWNFFFLCPRSHKPFSDSAYSKAFEVPAHKLIGKRTSPHTMRYVWATWAFQKGLNDRELESLAYSMGHDVAVLRRLYERCTASEKRRPIEQAIEQSWEQSFGLQGPLDPLMSLATLMPAALNLSPDEQLLLIKALCAQGD